MDDQVTLCSEALVSLGCDPIDSLVGDDAEQMVAKTLYSGVVGYCFSAHPWRFGIRSIELSRDVAEPKAPYDASYGLPAQVKRIIAVRVNDQPIRFDRYENKILCDAGEDDLVVAEVSQLPDPDYWPDYFRSYVVAQLAANFALPITEDPTKANMMLRAASMSFTAAKTADSQGRTARRMPMGGFAAYVAGGRL